MSQERVSNGIEVGNHETLNGGTGADFLAAGMNNETVHGGSRKDVIIGDTEVGANVVSNGDFELHPDYNYGDYGFFYSIDSWNRWGRNRIEVEDESRDATDSDTGSVVELDADGNSGLYQSLYDLEGKGYYQLGVDFSALPGTVASTNTIEIWFGGELIDTVTADGTNLQSLEFNTLSYTVQAPSNGSTWIGFRAVGDDDYYGGIIDNVTLGLIGESSDASVGGNDYLDGGSGNDDLFGSGGHDLLEGGAGRDKLDGGEGIDTAVYINATGEVKIDLEKGRGSGDEANGDRLINIENVLASNHNDEVTGDDGANRLNGVAGDDEINGGGGNDVVIGGSGADKIDGGEGNLDVADYGASHSGVDVDLTAGVGRNAHAEGDELTNVEGLNGSGHDDILRGDANVNRLFGGLGDDELYGEAGNDVLRGGTGADVIDGGEGALDVADLSYALGAVEVDLEAGVGRGSSAEGDTYTNIEVVYGSDHNDVITGNSVDNRLIGNDGDDALNGGAGKDVLIGGAGADALDGGDGRADIASYQEANSGVNLSLATGGVSGEAAGDTFTNIEVVYGSDFGDTIEGDGGNNRLVGFNGDDALNGGAGHDYIIGGLGNDTLTGGAGIDTFLMDGVFNDDVIVDFEAGAGRTDRLWFKGLDLTYDELNLQESTEGVLIVAGDFGSVLLEGVAAVDLATDDFLF